MSRLLALAALLFSLPAHAVVNINWVTVGDSGNAADTEVMTCCDSSTGTTGYGAVSYEYRISRHETTNAQYAEFLNAVGTSDPNGIYSVNMGSLAAFITRSGSPGSYTYSVLAGRESTPVNFVSFYNSLRFANWLHNGQPTGAQDNTTTEDGAYTFTCMTCVGARNASAKVFLASDDEWYKAAYYDANTASYLDFPTGTDTQVTCTLPGATANTANCIGTALFEPTPVGGYTNSVSPSGTFDQGGNIWEWNDTILGTNRFLRGGNYDQPPESLAASFRWEAAPALDNYIVGFRVASSVPPVPTPALGPMGLLLVATGVLGFAGYRWSRV